MSPAHDNMTMALVPHNIASCTSLHHVRLSALCAGSIYPNLGRVLLLNELAISKHVSPNILKLSKRKLQKSDLVLKYPTLTTGLEAASAPWNLKFCNIRAT